MTIAKQNDSSWFSRIRHLCLQYSLPHPLTFLNTPPTNLKFKSLIKSKVLDFWETKLRNDAAPLTSLSYFKPSYMSLARPHAIWWTAGANPYEVSKAVIQCRMLSGRYRTFQLSRNWSESRDASCPAPSCTSQTESLEHILIHCPAYSTTRDGLLRKWRAVKHPGILELVKKAVSEHSTYLMQFILDASVQPESQSLMRTCGEDILYTLFSLTRSWCYSIHRDRLNLIKRVKSSKN